MIAEQVVFWKKEQLTKRGIDIVQINMGNRCNQTCSHCHIGASPQGDLNMDHATARRILDKLLASGINHIEFTGGTPELNPHFAMFIEELSRAGRHLAVRTSLTVLDIPEYACFVDLYKKHNVKVVASLPGIFEDQIDRQRGKGVFEKTLRVLKRLNDIGYGTSGLSLDFVYNPTGDCLPIEQVQLEGEYKKLMRELYGISFDNLITIVNSPIKRFRQHLIQQGRLEEYMRLLVNNFNPATLDKLMCRHLISVDYQGYVYDCDFNLALGIRIKGYEHAKFWEIDFSDFAPEITCDEHCYACTANKGSGCHGALIKNEADFDVRESVRKYYGEELQSSADLKTTACCTPDALPKHVREVLPYIAEEIKTKYYGCGSPIPLVLDGLKVLDLGCGTGRDSYVLSKLVGERGFVYGIDMTEQQVEVARQYKEVQAGRFGYQRPNTEFILDDIEHAGEHFGRETLDLIISNCVINLVEDKEKVIRQVYELLKYGGEFYFSDIYADRRLPAHIRKDPVLYGECLGGALYYKDFERIARKAGFIDPRVVSKRTIVITNDEIKKLTGSVTFYSITYRLWKLEGLEDACEDYGHIAIYKGGVPESPFAFELDSAHIFERNRPERVCGNTALMLSRTRLKKYVAVLGDFSEHFGLFKNRGAPASDKRDSLSDGCC
ncbi:MAG: arsenosugar biosynthesis radical SAM (seleno)protein ArsS [Nitrospirota bacterium]